MDHQDGLLHFPSYSPSSYTPLPPFPCPAPSTTSRGNGHGGNPALVEELRQAVALQTGHPEPPSSSSATRERLDYFGFPATTATIHFDEDKHRVWYPHENYIPVNLHLLASTLLDAVSKIEEETGSRGLRKSFEELCGVYLYVVQAKHEALTRELQLYQTLFNPALRQSDKHAAGQGGVDNEARRQRMINSFIHNFVRTMRKANFNPLTQEQIKFAANPEQILFGVPMRIDWDKLDSSLLEAYFNSVDEPDIPPPPPFARNCLVFWRGVGVQRRTGRFVLAKLDLLIQRGLNILKAALSPILPSPKIRISDGLASMAQDYMNTGAEPEQPHTSIHLPRFIDRKTLLTTAASLFEEVTVEEPTYKEVVLLFKKKKNSSGGEDQAHGKPDENAIFIQRFYDIPMKNLQVVFPLQQAGWNWADMVSFLMLLSFSVTLAFKAFFTLAHSTYIDEAVLGILVLLFPLFVRWVNRKIGAQRSQYQAKNMAARSLRNNSLNCNKSVLSYIHEAAIEQEIKEALLAYFVIWQWRDGIRKDQLDAAIEHLIKANFGVEVDFEVDDALHKLLASSLAFTKRVTGGGEELYFAVPPHEALDVVQNELVLAAKRHFS